MMAHWVFEVIGKPWEVNQRGPDSFNCWGLLVYAFETQRGIHLPWVPVSGVSGTGKIAQDAAELAVMQAVTASGADWQRVEPPLKEWDIITMRGPTRRRHCALGVAANGTVMALHCDGELTPTGCVGSVQLNTFAHMNEYYKDLQLWRLMQ